MFIIPQKYNLEFKNYIKNKISSYLDNICDELIDNLFNYVEEKYLNFVSKIEKNVRELILNVIKETILFFDEKYKSSKERKKDYHINVSNDKRNIKTIFGNIDITRTYYETKDRKEHFYFIDALLELNKYDRYDPIYKSIAIDLAIKTNQKLAGELTGNFTATLEDKLINNIPNAVPRQTVHYWIKSWNIPIIDYPPIEIGGNTLYVMADEKYIHEQRKKEEPEYDEKGKKKKHHIMSKCWVVFSGIEQQGNRRVLKDKMVFITSSNNPWQYLLDRITKIYDFEKIENIVFLSDGGRWLTSGAYDLKMYPHNKIILCLCEFHARQKINRITTIEIERDELNNFIDSDNKKEFIEKMKIIKERKKDDEKRLKKLTEYENYIVNNWNKIQNMFKSECRSSMESHISHCVASYFSSRPKAFSGERIENYLKLVKAKINGIDIQKLYLKSYKNTEIKTIKNEELNFSIFESSSSSNIPVISNGSNNSLLQSLLGLANGNLCAI